MLPFGVRLYFTTFFLKKSSKIIYISTDNIAFVRHSYFTKRGDMIMTVDEKIKNKIKRASKGDFFILNDFSNIAEKPTIKASINKLVNENYIDRPYNGVYQKPKINQKFQFKVIPKIEEIVLQIARKNNQKIVPSGNTALNTLGLSTQVPAVYKYITNGPSRKFKIRETTIYFKHSGTKKFFEDDDVNTIFVVLTYLNDNHLKKISEKVDDELFKKLKKYSTYSTQKIQDGIRKLEEYRDTK